MVPDVKMGNCIVLGKKNEIAYGKDEKLIFKEIIHK